MSAPSPILAFTGAQGRLSRALLPRLAQSYPCLALSRQPQTLRFPASQPAPFTPIQSQSWEQFFAQAPPPSLRFVLHAAWSNTPISAESQSITSQDNLPLLQRLAEHLLQSPQPARLIFFSSGSVYGHTPLDGASESTKPQPLGRYAQEKLAAEALLQDFAARGLPVTILRISNPYGFPFDAANPQGVIGHAIHQLKRQAPLTLWGENPVKDYLHIDDFSHALELLLRQPLDGLWNLSGGQGTPLLELLKMLQRLSGQALTLEHQPAHLWDANPSVLNSHALQTALDWKPQTLLGLGLKQVLASWQS